MGAQSSLSYAYVFAATLVSATASAFSLISSAPLTRRGIDAAGRREARRARRVAVAGRDDRRHRHLRARRRADRRRARSARRMPARSEASSAGWSCTSRPGWSSPSRSPSSSRSSSSSRSRRCCCRSPPWRWRCRCRSRSRLRAWLHLDGLAVALGVTTAFVLVVLLAAVSPRMLELAVVGLGRVALGLGALAAVTFGLASLVAVRGRGRRRSGSPSTRPCSRRPAQRPARGVGLRAGAALAVRLRQLGWTSKVAFIAARR